MEEISDIKFNQTQFLRDNYDLSNFRDLERGQHNIIADKIGVSRPAVSKIIDESRILSFFPNLEKSKAAPLARLRLDKELKLFSKKYDIYNLQVRELYKLVKEWRNTLESNPKILLTDLQQDLIIGTTIGDANIRQRNKNCMFRVEHSIKQKKYVEWKYEILKDFNSKGLKLIQKSINSRFISTYGFDINTHYVFNFYRKLFYNKKGKKIITKQILGLLNHRSLAIWLCDDGSYCKKQKYIILCTNSFTFEEHKLMKEYFFEVWGINPTIGFRDNKYYFLRFTKKDTSKFIEIVRLHIPEFIKYKIGE